jgi:hypothetical protein
VYDYKAAKKLKNNRLKREKMQKNIHKAERTMEKTQMNPETEKKAKHDSNRPRKSNSTTDHSGAVDGSVVGGGVQ